jgi:glycosyltransferase involved in cell wall biosynthesis
VKDEPGQAPLVSVVIPAFNAERTLAETVASASAQSWPNLEIVIVDDGSTDSTPQVAEALARQDPRITVTRKARGGCASARNAGMARARGDYIASLDADDLWHPEKTALQMKALLAPAAPAFVYCYARRLDGLGRVVGTVEPIAVSGGGLRRHLYTNFIGAGGSSIIFRRSALAAVGGYDETLRRCEGLLTQLRLVSIGHVEVVPLFLAGYRIGPYSQSWDRDEMFRSWLRIRALIEPSCSGTARRALLWGHGKRCLAHAESLAYRGRWGEALLHIAHSIRLDPSRNSLYLAPRLWRRTKRSFAGRSPEVPGPHFHDMDPAEGLSGAESTLFERFEARRFDRLRRFDEAGPRPG